MPLPPDEERITLARAARPYPGRGTARLHPATLTRWILQGVRGVDGNIVKLEAERIGYRWVTSAAAMQRFTNALASETIGPIVPRSPAARNRASEKAAKKLKQMGA